LQVAQALAETVGQVAEVVAALFLIVHIRLQLILVFHLT
jgi:hypothetical protein